MSVLITRYAIPFTGAVDAFARLKDVYVTHASDSFTRADADTLGSTPVGGKTWLSPAGVVFGIRSNRPVKISSSALPQKAVFDAGTANATLSGTIVSRQLAGLVFRETADGTGGGYMIWENGGVYTLSKRVGPDGYTHLVTSTRAAVVGDRITVILNGPSITVRINGTTLITATDATYATQVHFGIWCINNLTQSFDDLEVTSQTTISTYE